MCRAYFDRHKLPYVGLRYMNVYGPRQDYKGTYIAVIMKILDLISQRKSPIVYGDGSQAYDFVYVRDVARASRVVSAGTKRILFALSEGAGGLFIAGIAQDVIYIRMVEVGLWIALGFLVGLARREAKSLFAPLDRHHAKLLLGSFAAAAVATAAMNMARHVEGAWPRAFDSDTNAGLAYWMDKEFRLAVDPYATRIEFNASRVKGEGEIDVRWPDGSHDYALLKGGASPSDAPYISGRFFAHEFTPPAPGEGGAPRWLTIKVKGDSWVPADDDPASTDYRELTVYISNLWIDKVGDGPRPTD